MARERIAQIPLEPSVRNRIRALKGTDTYSQYLDRLIRTGSKDD